MTTFVGGLASGAVMSGVPGPMISGLLGPPPSLAPVALNPTLAFPNAGRFRRHLTGFTTDILNAPLPGATVKIFDVSTDLKVADLVSDVGGVYDFAVYADGTFYSWTRKAGSPNVFGGSDIVTPV